MGWLRRQAKRQTSGPVPEPPSAEPEQAVTADGRYHIPAQRSEVDIELAALDDQLRRDRPHNIGFPGATDFDYSALAPFFAQHLLNNVGDPFVDGAGTNHTKAHERVVVGKVADLLRAPRDDWWGYVTSGGSEGNLYALQIARGLYPEAMVYYSAAAHYSVQTAVQLLALPSCVIDVNAHDEMDYDDLSRKVGSYGERPAIVVATVGTTMTEAVDDVRRIRSILDAGPNAAGFVHADAALAGLPLALLNPATRPGMDFEDGADAVTISGHKFLGSPIPCGVVITRDRYRSRAPHVDYTASPNSTLGCSRSGHAPLGALVCPAHARSGWPTTASRGVATAGRSHNRCAAASRLASIPSPARFHGGPENPTAGGKQAMGACLQQRLESHRLHARCDPGPAGRIRGGSSLRRDGKPRAGENLCEP